MSDLAAYGRQFQVCFVKITAPDRADMRRSHFETVLNPFYRRYPQGNYLLDVYQQHGVVAFLSPENRYE